MEGREKRGKGRSSNGSVGEIEEVTPGKSFARKELNPPEIPTHIHSSLHTSIPTYKEKNIIKEEQGGMTKPKMNKKERKEGEKPTCEVLFVVLARNGEKKKHEEAAKCGGEKRWKRRNSSRSKLCKTSPRVSGGRTVIPAEQVRTDLFWPLQETQTWGRTDVLRLF